MACDVDATDCIRGNGSGDNSLFLTSSRGGGNGFGIGRVWSTCKTPPPLFLTGEKGLVEAMDGSVLMARGLENNCLGCRLGGVDGCVLALFSFLYSLYFSAEENSAGQRCSRYQSTEQGPHQYLADS